MSATVPTGGLAAGLLERLRSHRMLGGAPPSELSWLIAHSEYRKYPEGAVVASKAEPSVEMVVMLTGRIVVLFDHGTGRRHAMESRAGTVTGLLPFSRMVNPIADAVAVEESELLALNREHFPGLIRECPEILATLVHVMLDRARRSTGTNWQDEKVVSLGRLAAALAHELNNPASAAARSAARLREHMAELGRVAYLTGASSLDETQASRVADVMERCLAGPDGPAPSAIELSDREERLAAWLDAHDVTQGCSAALAESGIPIETLDELAALLPRAALDATVRWIAAAHETKQLAVDVERASGRIHDLVSAVKRFTHMDRAAVQATDVAQGLADAVAFLAPKAQSKDVEVRLDIESGLPTIQAETAALNQVWSNILDNALDAVSRAGHVVVGAARDGTSVVVRFVDDGPGIAPEVQSKMFDPFFTTKPPGQGIGLGLDIALQVVQVHRGKVDVETRPGRTEFRVTLPLE